MIDGFEKQISPKRRLTQTSPEGYSVSDGQRASKSRYFIRGFLPHPLRRPAALSAVLSKAGSEAAVSALHSMAPPGLFLPRRRTSLVPDLQHDRGSETNLGYSHPGLQPLFSTSPGIASLSLRHQPPGFLAPVASPRTSRLASDSRHPARQDAQASVRTNQLYLGFRFDVAAPVPLVYSTRAGRLQSSKTSASQLSSFALLRWPHSGYAVWSSAPGRLLCRNRLQTICPNLSGQTSPLRASQKSLGPAPSRCRLLSRRVYSLSRREFPGLRGRRQTNGATSCHGRCQSLSRLSPTWPLAGDRIPVPAHGVAHPPSLRPGSATQTLQGRTSPPIEPVGIQQVLVSRFRHQLTPVASGCLSVLYPKSRDRTGYSRTQKQFAARQNPHHTFHGQRCSLRTHSVDLRFDQLVPKILLVRILAKGQALLVAPGSLHAPGAAALCPSSQCPEAARGLPSSPTLPDRLGSGQTLAHLLNVPDSSKSLLHTPSRRFSTLSPFAGFSGSFCLE